MGKERDEFGWMNDFRAESRDMKLCFPALSSRFSLDVCRHVCMLFTNQIFKNVQYFPMIKKNQTSIYFKTSKDDFQTLSQTIGWDFEAFIGNQKQSLVFEKLSHMFEL